MSDKLQEDFNIYYLELKNFTENFKTSSQAVETDKLLSRAGKFEQVEKLRAEHLKSVDDLGERFRADFEGRQQRIKNILNGKKNNVDLEYIKSRFSKGESLSGDETNRLLLHEMSENKTIMRKSSFQNMLANADNEQVRKTAQTLSNSQDVERLGWLQEMASLRGEEVLSKSLAGQIKSIRTETYTDEQKNYQELGERIEKGRKLFTYSIEKSKTGTFMDVRQEEIIDESG